MVYLLKNNERWRDQNMSVHKALTKHVNGLSQLIKEFAVLDEQRELFIEEACSLCNDGKPFTTDKINEVTERMNQLSRKIENLPERKYVTAQMIAEFVQRSK